MDNFDAAAEQQLYPWIDDEHSYNNSFYDEDGYDEDDYFDDSHRTDENILWYVHSYDDEDYEDGYHEDDYWE